MNRMNFDLIHDRKGTCCSKWDFNQELFGREDLTSMWVADMDFSCPPEVFEAIQQRMNHPILGYTRYIPELIDAIVNKMKTAYNWKIEPEWIVLHYNVMDAIRIAIDSCTKIGDEIIIQPPVYYPFFSSIKQKGRQIKENKLKFQDNKYYIDFENLVSLFDRSNLFGGNQHRITGTILCNPHNPVGRAWSKEDLLKYGEICLKNNVTIISDEIHCDIIYKGQKHYPIASLSKELEQNTITCMSGGKTFNLGGMGVSFTIVPNKKLRDIITKLAHHEPSVLSMYGLAAAIKAGEEYYIKELVEYLENNLNYVSNFIQTNIPQLKVVQPDATYLVWIDFSALNLNREKLKTLLINKARIAADYGYMFGENSEHFIRFNIAAPLSTIKEALERLAKAIN